VLLSSVILACRLTPTRATQTTRSTHEPEPTPTIKVILPEKSVYPSPNGRELGEANAPVTVEVFSDFQCPACRQYAISVEPKIIRQYVAAGKVQLMYRHYPFIGDESFQAARASMCAAKQERFWEYDDLLFTNWDGENQGAFGRDKLLAFGKAIDEALGQP
jgi:protein-disulfide isomerase